MHRIIVGMVAISGMSGVVCMSGIAPQLCIKFCLLDNNNVTTWWVGQAACVVIVVSADTVLITCIGSVQLFLSADIFPPPTHPSQTLGAAGLRAAAPHCMAEAPCADVKVPLGRGFILEEV